MGKGDDPHKVMKELLGVMKMLCISIGVMVTWSYSNALNSTLKRLNFAVCKLYLNKLRF